MSDRACQQFLSRDEMTAAAWRQHLEGCRQCQLEHDIDRRLLTQEELGPVPSLPSSFTANVLEAVRLERGLLRSRAAQRLMQLYWLAAALGAILVLWQISWPQTFKGSSVMTVLFALLLPVVALLVLGRLFRLDLGDLVERTLR